MPLATIICFAISAGLLVVAIVRRRQTGRWFSLLVALLASSGCCSSAAPAKAWPLVGHRDEDSAASGGTVSSWQHLDPALCHPYPCRKDDPRVEWRGDWNMPSEWVWTPLKK